MSNHVTATQSKIILLKYSDGINTIVNCQDWKADAIVSNILNGLIYVDERYVWHIDDILNSYGLSQCMLPQGSTITHPEELIWVSNPYDLGENETEQDVQKYYPNYRRDEDE